MDDIESTLLRLERRIGDVNARKQALWDQIVSESPDIAHGLQEFRRHFGKLQDLRYYSRLKTSPMVVEDGDQD